MPKNEFDFEDPLELNGIALTTAEDTTAEMTVCFIEEFMMLGYNHKQILAMFRNPHYLGMNMVLQNQGEQFVKNQISDTFRAWGKPFCWPANTVKEPGPAGVSNLSPSLPDASPTTSGESAESHILDPLGNPAPALNL